MKSQMDKENDKILKIITNDRLRTNILKNIEQKALVFLVQRLPSWISPNLLTGIGLSGSFLVFMGFLLAAYFNRNYLLLGVPGLMISWFGDSLDGRIAYYRNTPRRLYGFILDITFDWIGIIIIGYGFMLYTKEPWDLLGYGFVVFYGWEMIIALMRYKITGKYSIDSGKLGPTEARILLMAILVTEILIPSSILYSMAMALLLVFIVNIIDTRKLLLLGDEIDTNQT
jgi:phosphatidylglycerophosphate synthase